MSFSRASAKKAARTVIFASGDFSDTFAARNEKRRRRRGEFYILLGFLSVRAVVSGYFIMPFTASRVTRRPARGGESKDRAPGISPVYLFSLREVKRGILLFFKCDFSRVTRVALNRPRDFKITYVCKEKIRKANGN